MVSSLVGWVGTFAVILGVLGFLVLSFVGSSASVSSTVRSALDNENVRRVIAEELVNKLETGGDSGERIVIRVARSKVIEAVEASLGDRDMRDAAGDTAAVFYGVFVEGLERSTVNIQIFADQAFSVIQSIDPSISRDLSPRVDPLEISRGDSSLDLARIRTWALIAPWVLLVGGLVLLAIYWFVSVAGKWILVRRIGIRFSAGGTVLILLAYVARTITFGGDSSGRIGEALVSFATSRLLTWSIVLTGIGLMVTLLGATMNQRVRSGQPSRSE